MIAELLVFDSHISCPPYWLWQECGKHSMKTIWKQLKVCFDGKAAAVARGEAAATTMAAARRLSNATRYPIVFRSCTPYGTAWIFNNVKNTCDLLWGIWHFRYPENLLFILSTGKKNQFIGQVKKLLPFSSVTLDPKLHFKYIYRNSLESFWSFW